MKLDVLRPAIEQAVKDYRDALDTYQPTNGEPGDRRDHDAACAGEELADRIEAALRGNGTLEQS